jgi:cytochrome c biogenesis protein CcdA
MVMFGLIMAIPQTKDLFSRIISPMANQASALSANLDKRSSQFVLLRALLMGTLLGFVWTPCSGPLLGSTLSLAASGGAVSATVTLAFFGLGAAIPLISVGYLSRSTLGRVRAWVISHGARAQQIMGIFLATVGLMVLFHLDKMFEAAMIRILPESWTRFTTMF